MTLFKGMKEKYLSGLIILVSLAGIIYFGIMAVRENSADKGPNPYEYNIKAYKKQGKKLQHYSEVKQIKLTFFRVYGLFIGPEDRIYVSGDSSVLILNSDGSRKSIFKVPEPAYCLAVSGNQDIYLGMKDHIEVFESSGNIKSRWKSLGKEAIITSIALSKNHLYIADAGNHIVWKYSLADKKILRIGAKDREKDIPGFIIPSPYFDLAVDPEGFLWVANTGRHSLENYTPDGSLRTSWGKASMDIEDFCGCCNPTNIAILADGSFVTSEKGIPRVKIYNRLGNLVSMVAGPDEFLEGTRGLDLAVNSLQQIHVLDPPKKLIRIFAKKRPNERETP